MRRFFIFGALIALIGWASWRLYPRQRHPVVHQSNEPILKRVVEHAQRAQG